MNVLTTGKRFSNRLVVEEIRTSDDGAVAGSLQLGWFEDV